MPHRPRGNVQFNLAWLVSALLLLCAAAVFFSAFYLEPTDAQCDRHSYSWSPAMGIVEYHWETFEFEESEFTTSKPSPYYGFKPTDEIENAWNELLPEHPISIPDFRLRDLGLSSAVNDSAWIRDPRNNDNILALPEYSVQLGCLNFLRQLGHRGDHDFTHLASFQGGDSLVWDRAYQCIERLRQAVMCWGDVGSILLHHGGNTTTSSQDDTVFDFGTLHYCRNFESIIEWTRENGVRSVTMDNLWWGGSGNV